MNNATPEHALAEVIDMARYEAYDQVAGRAHTEYVALLAVAEAARDLTRHCEVEVVPSDRRLAPEVYALVTALAALEGEDRE